MMEAAFLAAEHLEGLLPGADRVEAFLRERERDLLVAAAMHQQEGAFHLLHNAVEAETLELLERRGAIGHAQHPLQLLGRPRAREDLAGAAPRQPLRPERVRI